MSNAWALTSCLLEDTDPVQPPDLTPEQIDQIDDPEAYIRQRFSDFYFEFQSQLEGRSKKKLANNTYLLRQPNGTITVRYHNTDIITVTPDNRVIVDTRGKGANKYLGATTRWGMQHAWAHYGETTSWHTTSTLKRVNQFLPGKWRIFAKKPRREAHTDWTWYWYDGSGKKIEFTDGDVINNRGELEAQAA